MGSLNINQVSWLKTENGLQQEKRASSFMHMPMADCSFNPCGNFLLLHTTLFDPITLQNNAAAAELTVLD